MKESYSNMNIWEVLEVDPTAERTGFRISGSYRARSHESVVIREERVSRKERIRLGIELRKKRESCGYTQKVVSWTIGIPQSDISKIESGAKAEEFVVIMKLLALYDMPVEHLFSTEHYRARADWWKNKLLHDKSKRNYWRDKRKQEAAASGQVASDLVNLPNTKTANPKAGRV